MQSMAKDIDDVLIAGETIPLSSNDKHVFYADPSIGYLLKRWEGAFDGYELIKYLTMNSNKTIKAIFAEQRTLTIQTEGPGSVKAENTETPTSFFEEINGVCKAAINSPIKLTAQPESPSWLIEWRDGENNVISHENPLQITLSSNMTVKAVFHPNVALAVNKESSGDLPQLDNLDHPGYISSVQASYSVPSGDTIRFTPQPWPGSLFVKWKIGAVEYTDNPLDMSFTANSTITCQYTVTQYITVKSEGPGGIPAIVVVSPSGNPLALINSGTDGAGRPFESYRTPYGTILNLMPVFSVREGEGENEGEDENTLFVHWCTDDGTPINYNNPYSITMNTSYTRIATYSPKLSLQVESGAHGSVHVDNVTPPQVYPLITPIDGVYTCPKGTSFSLRADADNAYAFLQWKDNTELLQEPASFTYVLNDDTPAAHTLHADFASIVTVTITVSANGSLDAHKSTGELLTDSDTENPNLYVYEGIADGSTIILNPVPASTEYILSAWTGDLSSLPYTTPANLMVNGSITGGIAFSAANTLTIAYDGPGTASVISAEVPPASVSHPSDNTWRTPEGDSLQLTANPSPGSRFLGWTGDLVSTTTPVNISMEGTGNKAVTAHFAPRGILTISVEGSLAQPSVSNDEPDHPLAPVPEQTGQYYAPIGDTLTVNAPEDGGDSVFICWKNDAGQTLSIYNAYQFELAESATILHAIYMPKLTVVAHCENSNGTISSPTLRNAAAGYAAYAEPQPQANGDVVK